MNHIGTQILETERLVLRKVTENDAVDMYNNWASDEDVTKYVTWKAHKNLDETKNLLSGWEKEYQRKDCYRWFICLKDTNELAGTIDVCRKNDDLEMAEIGYCISKKHWNKGIVTEACKEVIKFLFEKVGYNRIQAQHIPENIGSGKVMQKCGMKFEGIIRHGNRLNTGELCDIAQYSILKKEFNKGEL